MAEPLASDRDPTIAGFGNGDVVASVVSLSRRHPDGEDEAYLRWHLLDHLPEQYRLAGLRLGQRFVSTAACRAARAASEAPFDDVDHIVQYLFAEPVQPALDAFFPLGGALRGIGRMPMVLPRIQVGGWAFAGAVAADRALVGAAVLPWRPATGTYVVIEAVSAGGDAGEPPVLERLAPLVAIEGVAGAWTWSGAEPRDERLETTAGLMLTICYLDAPAVEAAPSIGSTLAERWRSGGPAPLLAAPFELPTIGALDRHLP